jgi:hypothetical protein
MARFFHFLNCAFYDADRNRNLSKLGTGTVTFQKSEPEP